MTKKQKLIEDVRKALEKLHNVNFSSQEEIVHDGAIQRFEFSFELCWKLMQVKAAENGIESFGPRNAIRNAARLQLIENPDSWMKYLGYRNLSTHTYDQKSAKEIFVALPGFLELAKPFLLKMESEA